MMKSYINYIDYYLPEQTKSASEILREYGKTELGSAFREEKSIERFLNTSKLDRITCFRDRAEFITGVETFVENMLKKTGISPDDIGYLVSANEVLQFFDGFSVCHYVKEKFALSKAVILPILQPCTASLLSMGISTKLFDEEHKYIMILSAYAWPHTLSKWDNKISRCVDFTIMGDGIALTLLSSEKGMFEISTCDMYNYCRTSYNMVNYPDKDKFNRMAMIQEGVDFLNRVSGKYGFKINELSRIIQPNVRKDVYSDVYGAYLDIHCEKFFFNNIPYGGHICDVDILRNLKDYADSDAVAGDIVGLYSIDIEPSYDINYSFITLRSNGKEQ